MPQRQIEGEEYSGEQGGVGGFHVLGQLLPEETRQEPKNNGGDGQTPEGDGVGTDMNEFHNQAAQPENNAADNQQRRGVGTVGGRHGVSLWCFSDKS